MSRPLLHLLNVHIIYKFWDNVWIRTEDECWPYVGNRDSWNYGHLVITKQYGGFGAHVIAWVVTNKQDVPYGLLIRHTCNYPPCCNPKHLIPGTHRQNMADRKAAGNYGSGIDNPSAKLSEKNVKDIKTLLKEKKVTQTEIAKMFGVGMSTISRIKKNTHWKEIT